MIEKEKVWETLDEKDEMSDSDADDNEKMNGDDREANCGEPDTDEESSSSTEEEVVCIDQHRLCDFSPYGLKGLSQYLPGALLQ